MVKEDRVVDRKSMFGEYGDGEGGRMSAGARKGKCGCQAAIA